MSPCAGNSSRAVRWSACSSPSMSSSCERHWMRHCGRADGNRLSPAGRHLSMSRATQNARPIVYVVDDDISVREALEGLITEAGWQPAAFASAEEFLVRPRESVPSCLVLDVSLPNLN